MPIIYSLWLQGYDHAPDQVKTCLDRWSKLNPTYTFELLEESDVQSLLRNFPTGINDITQQSVSDILRLALLEKTGGIWVDATVFPTKPLSEWFEKTVGDADFFSYRHEVQKGNPTNRPISAWFLYASKGSTIIEKLWRETLRYWSVNRQPMSDSDRDKYFEDPIAFMGLSQEISNSPYPYHWFQHIFSYLEKNDPLFAEIWDSCPHKTIENSHQMQYWAREDILDGNTTSHLTEERIKDIIENSEMQKLNWRMDFPLETMEKYSVHIPSGLHGESFLPKFS